MPSILAQIAIAKGTCSLQRESANGNKTTSQQTPKINSSRENTLSTVKTGSNPDPSRLDAERLFLQGHQVTSQLASALK